jgi:hypothetical protein
MVVLMHGDNDEKLDNSILAIAKIMPISNHLGENAKYVGGI